MKNISSVDVLFLFKHNDMSRCTRKPTICLCKNKDADQLRSNCEADQRLCFRYTDNTIPLLLKSEISSFDPSSVAARAGLCQTPKTGFYLNITIW